MYHCDPSQPMPQLVSDSVRHIAFLPDGSRRWAERHGLARLEAYRLAMRRVYRLCQISFEAGIDYFSVFLAGSLHFLRPVEEIADFLKAEEEFVRVGAAALAKEFSLSIVHAGSKERLPSSLSLALDELVSSTKDRSRILYLCLDYDIDAELKQAIVNANIVGDPTSYSEHLWVKHPVDLVIRTGGTNTLSHFLALQCAYARIVFVDEFINDFTDDHFSTILRDGNRVPRAFGR